MCLRTYVGQEGSETYRDSARRADSCSRFGLSASTMRTALSITSRAALPRAAYRRLPLLIEKTTGFSRCVRLKAKPVEQSLLVDSTNQQ